jgi:hypothetical protein
MTPDEVKAAFTRQHKEWQAIRDELFAKRDMVTAHQVTTEHRKRMLARGEREVTADELAAAVRSAENGSQE